MFTYRIDDHEELRLLEERHAEELFALIDKNRDYFLTWMPGIDASIDDTRQFIKCGLERLANNNGLRSGVWYEGNLVGVIGYKLIDWTNRNVSIQYFLGPPYQGKGLMTKACRALVDYAFNELKLHRVDILCASGNLKSRAIPERLGFRQEGVIREIQWLHGRFVDLVIYGMLASEWNAEDKP